MFEPSLASSKRGLSSDHHGVIERYPTLAFPRQAFDPRSSKRADRVRIVWWDGSGVCLYSKTLEEQSFCWPGISAARVRLDHSQLMALLAGMDWRKIRPAKVRRPLLTG